MSEKYSRGIKFVGAADIKDNVSGNFSTSKVVFYDDFLGDALDGPWAPSGDNGGTEAITAGTGGTATLTTGGTDDDRSILAHGINWYPAQECVVEVRFKLARITLAGAFIGFSDAVTEANDQIPFEINGTTITDRADNGAGFCFDTDATNDYWYIVNSLATVAGGTNTAVAPVANTYETLRVAIDTAGNAYYWRNGVAVGYKALATTTTVGLVPVIAVINRAGAALVGTVDYVKCWQNRT